MIKASVIIPSYNEERDIGKCLKSLQSQTLKDFEVIVVDDGSTDNTRKIVKKFKKVKLLKGKHKGPGFSRNLGSKKAKGKILVFIDSDMEFDKDYLKNLILPIEKEEKLIGTTHELEIVKNTNNVWSKCWGRIRVSKKNAHKVKIFRAIRKDKFHEFKGFDPKYGYADDQTFWFKYHVKPKVAKDTICYHQNPTNLHEVYKQSRWIGASIDNRLFKIPIIRDISFVSTILLSPLIIPIASLNKCRKIRNFRIFPYMLVFMTYRFFGNIMGIFRNIYLKTNVR